MQAKPDNVGSTLARISSASENSFVQSHLPGESWLGGTTQGHPGTWVWQDGNAPFWSASGPVAGMYADWGWGKPSNHGSTQCLAFDSGQHGAWEADSCTDKTRLGMRRTYPRRHPVAPHRRLRDHLARQRYVGERGVQRRARVRLRNRPTTQPCSGSGVVLAAIESKS